MSTLLLKHADLLVTMDDDRRRIADGGVFQPDWKDRAVALHRQFVEMNLSPGGSADLLAATLIVGRLLQRYGGGRTGLKDGTL